MIVGASAATRILGGTACAEEQIIVGEVGSDLGARTVLSVGIPLAWDHEPVESKLRRGESEQEEDEGPDCEAAAARMERSVASTRAARKLLKTAEIRITGRLHPGVVIEIGELSLTVQESNRGVRFRYRVEDDQPVIERVKLES